MTPEEQLLKDDYGIELYKECSELEKAISNLVASKVKADETIAKIKAISKSRQPHKPYISPYAKFDKYHKKKRK